LSVSPIAFLVDESVRYKAITAMLVARGYAANSVTLREKDAAILRSAEESGQVIVTADADYKEVIRFPSGHPKAYIRAGVVLLCGDMIDGHEDFERWLPLVDLVWFQCQSQASKRFVIDISNRNQFRITFGNDPKPKRPAPGTSERQTQKRQQRAARNASVLPAPTDS